ncbi:TonB family protein [Carboxylicivirga sp. M1479]|uniref:M56 family metallopeptidase n=1 Tax=Carboxylicivirga sp. M1479 TaxID=2594476 RepID=UPI001177A696|nr:M56 family metallopeptidase [Carboxylicivirga sp. M1479]TRX72408.1 M56 family metallopeptidase [Carboxylicivirga sp. M1479]
MNLLVNYLFESALILGLLTAFYRLVLHAEPTFKFNRYYLLLSLLLATVVPILSFTIDKTAAIEGDVYVGNVIDTITVYAQNTKAVVVPVVAKSPAFKWLYSIGCLGLLLRLAFGFIRLGGLAGRVKLVSFKGYKVADLPGQFNPFSFFNVVFINQSRYSDKELEQIMIHELTHVRLKHTWDVLFLELLLIIQWFNPFAWLLRNMLKELHEFQADKKVLEKGFSANSYKELLLFQATGARLLPVNNFNQSLTKKRFSMMTKNNFNKIFGLKPVLAIVTISLVAVLFACELREVEPELTQDEAEIKEAIENTNAQLKTTTGPVFFVVEEMPEYPGGEDALRTYISTAVKYPEEAKNAGASGRVYISFVVAKDGFVRDIKIARSSGHSILDEEAIRVTEKMPQWKPGMQRGEAVNVSYTIPINFALNGETASNNQKTPSKLDTPEKRAAFAKEMKEKGATVEFNEDGSFSLIMEKGTATPVQNN